MTFLSACVSEFGAVGQSAVLEPDEVTLAVEVGDLQPGDAVAVAPGGEAAPADDAWVEVPDVEEKMACFGAEVGVAEVGLVAGGIEGGVGWRGWRGWRV